MTPEEQRLLTDLAGKIAQTPPPPRDPEAEDFIRKNIGSRPDALYLMTQTVLIQNMAIQQAQQQIRELQQQQQQRYPAATGSFLGQQQPAAYPQPPQPYAPQPLQYAPPQGSSGSGPGFLRGAAQTAAGVAAGALAFEGIRSLFSHPGFGMGQTGFMGGGIGGGMPVEETVVNNYYDSPAAGEGGHRSEQLADASDNQYDDSSSSNNDDDAQTQDADYDTSSDDSFSSDDSSSDMA